jgi:cytochrome c2
MKVFLKVFLFNVALIGFFLYVGNSIPQQRKDPPKELELSADMTPADFIKAGETIFYGKGTCALCHEIAEKGERCPGLAGVGERATKRFKEARYQGTATSAAEYIAESLHNPAI